MFTNISEVITHCYDFEFGLINREKRIFEEEAETSRARREGPKKVSLPKYSGAIRKGGAQAMPSRKPTFPLINQSDCK